VLALVVRAQRGVVTHAAAWTDVDGCAKDPGLAMRRNAEAAGILARELARHDVELVLVSTNGSSTAAAATAWATGGPPGNDFPEKIARAALRAAAAGEPLRVVADEIGSPTYTPDLAEAIVELLAEDAIADRTAQVGVHHLVNAGIASRADWAREVLRATGIDVEVQDVPGSTWQRASTPPAWAVLEPTPLPSGEPMRDWREAFAHAVPALRRTLARG
jgi:dTDP-4-dehydrorhamnose reductase